MGREARWRAWAVAALVVLFGFAAQAAAQNPVTWSASSQATTARAGDTIKVEVVARMDEGWHLYSVQQPPPPIATKISVPSGQPFALAGEIQAPQPHVAFDASFGIDTGLYEKSATFTVPVKVGADARPGRQALRVQARYQACNNQMCLPPKTVTLEVALDVRPATGSAATGAPATSTPSTGTPAVGAPATSAPATGASATGAPATGAPATGAPATSTPSTGAAASSDKAVRTEAAPTGKAAPVSQAASSTPIGGQSLWSFLWLAMSVGALSLLTPCVFPMVPITVSYFTSHAAGNRRKAVQQAATYTVGIILTFTALGMALALLVGATSLNRFAANPWVNIAITAIFVGFALSLLGVFDLQVPPSLVNRLDSLTRREGGSQTIATLLMGLTFTLTSFTCTAPFIGTLLVMAAGGNWQWPLVGMLAFSTVFALPFFLLALMPQWMTRLPRSGGWLNSVKVMMAFLEIAAAMKFVSNVDLVWGWGIFTRDVVLASWVVIGLLMALYVIGLFRFKHDSPVQHVGLVRLASALLCGTVAIWLLTGLFGKRLGEIEAFLPPAADASVEAATFRSASELPWITNDYEGALARAREEQKQVFIDFTGYTCTNCRWMEANMFTRPEVQYELRNYVLLRLYTDGEGEIYERQQRLQQAKYQTVALPFYAVVDASGQSVVSFPGLTRDPAQFVSFLRRGRPQASTRHGATS